VEESEDESVVSSFGEVDQSEFDMTPHKTAGSELEEASEDEQTEQANVNDETLNTSVEAGNLMDVTTENDLTNALNADSTIGKYESEPEDDVNVTGSENQSDQENLSTKADELNIEESSKADNSNIEESSKADSSNIEESSKADSSIVEESSKEDSSIVEESGKADNSNIEESSKADNSIFEESMNSADDGDELDNTRQVFANDLEPDNDDCNLDDHKADQTNDNEDLNTNLCDTKDETVVLNSPDQQNLGETFDATDVQLPTNNEDNSTCLYEDKKNEQDSIPDISSGCVADENVKETEKNVLNQNVNITKDNENDDTCLPTESLDEDNIDNAPQVSERKEDFSGVSEEKQNKSLTTVNKMDMPEQHEITNRDSTTSSNAEDHTNLPINTSNVTRRSKVKKLTLTKRLTEENRNKKVILKEDKAPVADLKEKQDQEVVDEDTSSSVKRRTSSRRSKAPTKYKDYFESKEKDEDVSENLDFVGVASPETSKSRNGLKSTRKRSSTTTNASEPKTKRQKEVGSSKSKNEESSTPNRRSNRIKAMTPSKLSSKSDSETLKNSKPNSKKRSKSDILSPSSKKVNFKTPPKVQRDPLIIYTKRTPRPSIKIRDSIESARIIETQQNKEDKPTKVNKSTVTNKTRNKKASGSKNKNQRATIKKKPASSKTTPRKSKVDKKSEVNSSESDDKKFTPSRFAKSKSKSSNIKKKDSDSSASNTPLRVKKKNDKKPSSSKAASSDVKSPSQQLKKKNLKRSDKNSAASSNNKTKKSGVEVSVKDNKATTSARDRSKSLKRKTEEKSEQNNLNSSSSDDMPLQKYKSTKISTSSLTSKKKKISTTSEVEIRSPKPPVAIKRSKRSAAKKPVNYVAPSTTQKVRRGDNTYKNN